MRAHTIHFIVLLSQVFSANKVIRDYVDINLSLETDHFKQDLSSILHPIDRFIYNARLH